MERRRFDPSSSPSASQIWGCSTSSAPRAQNPADFCRCFYSGELGKGFSCSRQGPENAFFSAAFVPVPGVPFPICWKPTRLRATRSNPSLSTEKNRSRILRSPNGICQFDTCRPSQPLAQPERVGSYWLEPPHFIGFSCSCPILQSLENGNLSENMPKVSSPNRRNSRFRGDDWRRPVRSPLTGRKGSVIAANAGRHLGDGQPDCVRDLRGLCTGRADYGQSRTRPPARCHRDFGCILNAQRDDGPDVATQSKRPTDTTEPGVLVSVRTLHIVDRTSRPLGRNSP